MVKEIPAPVDPDPAFEYFWRSFTTGAVVLWCFLAGRHGVEDAIFSTNRRRTRGREMLHEILLRLLSDFCTLDTLYCIDECASRRWSVFGRGNEGQISVFPKKNADQGEMLVSSTV